MIDKCGIAFFMFGTKIDTNTGKMIEASGMYEEFEIAHKQGKYVFPIGQYTTHIHAQRDLI